jgi:hypothetical protein
LPKSWAPERLDNVSGPCKAGDETESRLDITRGNVSSDFMRTLSSIPNERGFKMAFLNIVSLPKKIDEINFSMSNKFIDLIALMRHDLMRI